MVPCKILNILLVDSKFTLSFNVAFSNEFQQKENEDHSCILIRDPYFENMNIMNSLHDDNLIENVAETIWSNSYDKVEGESEVGGSGSWGGTEQQWSKGDLVNWN